MGILRKFWREFIGAFRAERQGGATAKASREHEAQLRRELRDEVEGRRLAQQLAVAKNPEEQRIARDEIINHVVDNPNGSSDALQAATDDDSSNELVWSSDPGAHEAHLARRYDNPYFPESRRRVTELELEEAKLKDDYDYQKCQKLFEILLEEINGMPETVTSVELIDFRERVEELIHFAMSVGGPAKRIASNADQLRDKIILDLRNAFVRDDENLESIEIADSFHKDHMKKFDVPFVAQMLRGDGPISNDDLVPALLSEEPMVISMVLDMVSDEARDEIIASALMIMKNVLEEGAVDPQFEAKIAVLSD